MKILTVLSAILISNFAAAQGYHVMPGVDSIRCKATGQVDGIVGLFFTETTRQGQLCGGLTAKSENGTPVMTASCMTGHIGTDELVLSKSAVSYGEQILSLRFDATKGYSLVKAFVCDWNHEEKCVPGVEQVLAEEAVTCIISKLKY